MATRGYGKVRIKAVLGLVYLKSPQDYWRFFAYCLISKKDFLSPGLFWNTVNRVVIHELQNA